MTEKSIPNRELSQEEIEGISERDALNAAEEAAWEAERAARPAVDDWHHRFFDDIEAVTDELVKWVWWHVECAEAAGLPVAEDGALHGVIDAANELNNAFDEGADDDAIDKFRERLHEAITEAKHEASDVARVDYADRGPLFRQAAELEDSYLRGWARRISDIIECWRGARDSYNPADALRHYIKALRSLAFSGPPRLDQMPENLR